METCLHRYHCAAACHCTCPGSDHLGCSPQEEVEKLREVTPWIQWCQWPWRQAVSGGLDRAWLAMQAVCLDWISLFVMKTGCIHMHV